MTIFGGIRKDSKPYHFVGRYVFVNKNFRFFEATE